MTGGNVWLVGMPGAGKTTVGRVLGSRLGMEFVDADAEIQRLARRGVAGIFARWGEEGFRDVERRVLWQLAEEQGLLIAAGGGAVIDPHNRKAMRTTGRVVLLDAPLAVLRQRLRFAAADRPLLTTMDDIQRLFDERLGAYRDAAHVTVDAVGTVEEVAERVAEALT